MFKGSKAEPLRGKAAHLDNNRLQKEWAKVCLDYTGVSGAPFSRKSAKYGVVTARQGLGATVHHTLQRKASKTIRKGMHGSVFGPRRRERIAFLAKFGEAGLGRRKTGIGHSKTLKNCKIGTDESVIGLHRRTRIAFLAENGQAWPKRSKAEPGRSKTSTF